jgi:hypothetical protein
MGLLSVYDEPTEPQCLDEECGRPSGDNKVITIDPPAMVIAGGQPYAGSSQGGKEQALQGERETIPHRREHLAVKANPVDLPRTGTRLI